MLPLLTLRIDRSKREKFHKAARSIDKNATQILMQVVEQTITDFEEKKNKERS